MSDWFGGSEEGQLSVDVFREGDELIIRSLAAGILPEQLDIHLHEDVLTIRGRREPERVVPDEQWFYRECYWGTFSRSIVLPVNVSSERAIAQLKNGVVEIRLPIEEQGRKVKVTWQT